MKHIIYITLSCLIFAFSAAHAVGTDPMLFGSQEPHRIEINNRILAKVNGKPISLIDVMKKLDMVFYRAFPEYAEVISARFQFYTMHWKDVLKQLVDKELVFADFEETKIPVSNGDVRQEMETLFGPNMIENLDRAGLSFDEAFKMVHGDIAIRRMMFAKVNAKAMRSVTPQSILDAYEEYAKNNVRSHEWIYRVISIRDPSDKDGAETASIVYRLLTEDKVPLNELLSRITATGKGKNSAVSITDEMRHKDLEVSESFKEILFKMTPETYSQPIAQQSRRDKTTVYRVFYLKSIVQGGMVPFDEVEEQLKENLLEVAIDKETEIYFQKLREKFNVQEVDLSNDTAFQPFVLK